MLRYFAFSSIVPVLSVVCFVVFSPAKTEAATSSNAVASGIGDTFVINLERCIGCGACIEADGDDLQFDGNGQACFYDGNHFMPVVFIHNAGSFLVAIDSCPFNAFSLN